MRLSSLVTLLALILSVRPCAGAAADGRGLDLAGQSIDPLANTNRGVVLVFVTVDCPISNRYMPELQRLAARHGTNGVAFWLVYPDARLSVDQIRQHTNEFRCGLPVLRDPGHRLVRLAKATVTPEAAVFRARDLIYRGRIDNRYVDFGKARPAATKHDLDEVLTQITAGRRVGRSVTRAVGCYIPTE